MVAISSAGTGIWNAGASWSTGAIPTNADDVTILNTHTITVDTTGLVAKTVTINNGGTLSFSRTATHALTIGDGTATNGLLTVASGGTLDRGTSASPIPNTVLSELIFKLSGNASTGTIRFAGTNFYQYGAADWQLGTQTDSDGYVGPKFAFTLASDAAVGATTFVLTEDCQIPAASTQWIIVNDFTPSLLATEGSTGARGRRELCRATAYNAATKTITLSAATTKLHRAGTVIGFPERNVVTRNDGSNNYAWNIRWDTSSTSTVADWRNFEFRNCGQNAFNAGVTDSFASRTGRFVGFSQWEPSTGVGSNFYSGNTAAFLKGNGTFGEMRMCLCSALYFFEGVANVLVKDTQFYAGACNQGGNCKFYNCGWYTSDTVQTHFNQNVNNFFQNCTFMGSRLVSASSPCGQAKFVQCTFQGISEVDENVLGNRYEACTWLNITSTAINTSAENVYINNTITVPTSNTYYGQRNNKAQRVARIVRLQDCTANGSSVTQSQYSMGDLFRYDSATSPDPVFDGSGRLPSGSQYVAQLTTLSNVAYIPISFRYLLSATSSSETYTFTINIQGRGLASFPTASQVFIRVTAPGSTTPTVSTQVLSANNVWTPYSVTTTASTTGQFICEVVCNVHIGTGKLYIDFPTGMSSSSLIWIDGIPNENLQRLGSGLAYDVATEVWERDTSGLTTAGTTGKKLVDIPTAVSDADANKIADHTLRRNTSNVEASSNGDTLAMRSLYGMTAQGVHKTSISGTTLTVTKSDETTTLGTRTIVTDATSQPIVSFDTD